MNIRITHLEMTNFKCFRHKELSFSSNVTTLKGRNGSGKTTIADAILFCLFGKNTSGQSDLEIFKTRADGKVIPNIEHSVEISLIIDNGGNESVVTLKRTIKEVWVKKRGTDESVFKNNTVEYFINGETCPKSDYESYINNLIPEDVFRSITSPVYFLSLKWQVQRDFLLKLVGDITPEEIANTDDLAQFVMSLDDTPDGVDIVAYNKHLSYQIKKVKTALDRIPVRLEEQNKALPEKLDWDALQNEAELYAEKIKDADNNILAIRSGNGAEVKRDAIRKEINAIRTEMEKIENEQRTLLRIRQEEHDKAVADARHQFNALVTTQRDLETTLPSFDTLIARCRETAEDTFEKERAFIRSEWVKTQADFDKEGQTACPVCGHAWDAERMEEERAKFNERKAQLKAALTERAEKAKQVKADAEQEALKYEAQKAEKQKALADIKEKINKVFSDKQKLEKVTLPLLGAILKDNARYMELSTQLAEMQKRLDAVVEADTDTTTLARLQTSRAETAERLAQVQQQLATKQQYERIEQLIAGIEEEQKELIAQLSKLEKKEDIARQYQNRQNAILEERVNKHFSIVRWRMFKTTNNGGDPFDEPFCECLVNGIPYNGGLNQAARLNAGLDIINTLCRHYNVSAPITIDNSESNLNILETIGQQLRLQVADSNLQQF